MEKFVRFNEAGIQEESQIAAESPGKDWYGVGDPSKSKDKFFKLKGSSAKAMTKKEYEDYILQLGNTSNLDNVRAQRDMLLGASDWTQMPDAPLTEKQREAWKAYRQALRDFPSTIEEGQEHEFPEPPTT